MRCFMLLFTLVYSVNISSQINFEKGYFITNENIKTECFIKNYDWINAPKEIEYKLNDTAIVEKITSNEIKSFQIYNSEHYFLKKTFTIDENTNQKSEKIITITKLLRVVIEGNVNLYAYNSNIFLYEKDNIIKQLIYKKFQNDNKMEEDFTFRKEIYTNLSCNENKIDIRKLNYRRQELIEYISNYNKCKNSDYVYYGTNQTKFKFNFKILAGVNFYSMESKLTFVSREDRPLNNKSSSVNAIFGFETELLLPFNHNKWSVFLAPNYQIQNQELSEMKTNLYGGYNGIVEMKDDYSYIELPIGIRKYFYLNNKSKISIDMAYGFIAYLRKTNDRAFDPELEYATPLIVSENTKDSTPMFIRVGLGYNYNDRYCFSLNYTPIKTLSQSEINSFSILASYKLF
ncbi:hypothetical protein [Flavobacterium sp.]|jgi:hypothetical protein|uniref:hypothetical protein n=1 Tax=Flavobacterium sp. TaxID=239 RepID=UPI0037BF8CB2